MSRYVSRWQNGIYGLCIYNLGDKIQLSVAPMREIFTLTSVLHTAKKFLDPHGNWRYVCKDNAWRML